MADNIQTSSPSLPTQSEDELFGTRARRPTNYETIETLPLDKIQDDHEHDTLVSLPPAYGRQTQRQGLLQSQAQTQDTNTETHRHVTQPTQLIDDPFSEVSSPPAKPTVQVAASSPMSTPGPAARRPTGILASAMAPAGTIFRRPVLPVQRPIDISSDDEGSVRSSDSDAIEKKRSDIKTSTYVRKSAADKVPESPNGGLESFKSLTKGYGYKPTDYAAGIKRSSDIMANAYGNVSKKPRQGVPSRTIPVGSKPDEEPDMELDEILDFNERSKVRRMRSSLTTTSVRELYNALKLKKGIYEDAIDYVLLQSEKRASAKPSAAIQINDSEDELMMTPAANKTKPKPPLLDARQQAKKPTKSIHEKWTGTQTTNRKPSVPHKKLDVFDDPGPAPVKARKLVRGRKRKSPSPTTTTVGSDRERAKAAAALVLSDDSDIDEAGSSILSDREDTTFSGRVLDFFNTCTALDLQDTSGIAKDLAEHFVAKRPYKSLDAVAKVQNPNLKPTKSKRKPEAIGVRVLDKVTEMMESYEAVDFLVKECEKIAAPLVAAMKNWGVDIFGKSGDGELDLTKLTPESHGSSNSHDSGLGTPISDDDRDIKSATRKGFLGQPASMAEDIRMKDYQIVGLNWLSLLFREKKSCILADDMGLGKTLQTIAFVAHLAETGVTGPHLIVVPAATLENWLKEFHRFCPGLTVEPYYASNPTERAEMRESIDANLSKINVLITTYTIAKAKEDFPWLKNLGFICTIFDEGHQLKNADSKVTSTLMRIKSKFRLLLTGTPLQNNLKELISLLNFLMPSLFSSKREQLETIFKQDIKTIDEDASNREMLLSKKRIDRARSMLTPFILRRKKWQVLKDLPKKERKVEYCEMTAQQQDIYHGWLAKAYDVRERRANGDRVPADESSNILMRLRQASIHPLLFRRFYDDNVIRKISRACLKDPQWSQSNPDLIFEELSHYSDFEAHQLCAISAPLQKFMLGSEEMNASGKVEALVRLLKKFMSEGHRTLIFSQFVMVLDILEVVLSGHEIKFFRLDGNTKVSERQDLIDEFNEQLPPPSDPDYERRKAEQVPVFMLSTKAGGAGINLAAASRVIVFDSGFNPQDDVQAENRAHRIGQTKDVEVWRLVTKDSVEEQIFDMGQVKLRLDREVAGESTEDLEAGSKRVEEKEEEGKGIVEDMFFKHLDKSPLKKTVGALVDNDLEKPEKTNDAHKIASVLVKQEDNTPQESKSKPFNQVIKAEADADAKIKANLAAELSSNLGSGSDSDSGSPTARPSEEPAVPTRPKRAAAARSRATSSQRSNPSSRSSSRATTRRSNSAKPSSDLPTRARAVRPKPASRVGSGSQGQGQGRSQRSIMSYTQSQSRPG